VTRIAFVVVLLGSTGSSYAQGVSAPATDTPVFRTEVVVTAERGENDPQTLSVPTTILTRREIEARPGVTLAEAIETLPGFQMIFSSGTGFRPTTIARGFFGGGEAEYVKLLVDGIPLGDAESGLIDWQTVPSASIDRVEAVRGPASALYGDASLGGVVQVFTSAANTPRGRIAGDAGGFGHRSLSASLRQPVREFAVDLLASYNSASGFRARSAARDGAASIAAQRRNGSHQWTARSTFDYVDREEPGALTTVEMAEDRRGSNPLFQHDRDTRRNGYGALRYASTVSRFVYNVMAHGGARSGERLRTLLLAPGLGDRAHRDISTNTAGASVESSIDIRVGRFGGEFRSGGDFSRDRVETSYRTVAASGGTGSELSRFDGDRARVAAYASQSVDVASHLRVDAGLRWDRIGDAGVADRMSHTAWSPKIGATVFFGAPARQTAVFAHASRAFKAATLDQLFDPRPFPDVGGGTFVISNPTLRPQRAKSIEGGIRQNVGAYRWEMVLYRMRMADEIDFDPATFTYANIGRSTHSGAEVDTALPLSAAVSAGVNYAWTRVASGEAIGSRQLKNIPRHVVRPHLTLNLPYEASVHIRYMRTAGAFADDANQVRLADRSTFDARVSKRVSNATATLDLLNLTNDRYEEIGYVLPDFRGGIVPYLYPAQGFTLRAGLAFTF
jgi:outer membrane cobalamin receptor